MTPRPYRRRLTQALCTALLSPAFAIAREEGPDDALSALAAGGCALLMRHARTEPGIGDPPGFRLDDCRTQRNLSDDGRDQARRSGRWLEQRGLSFDAVFSSRWCRCIDTASRMFPGQDIAVMGALNSFFDGHGERERQTTELRAWIAALDGTRRVALVTHQVNILALTGENLAMGEAVIVQPDRRGGVRSVGRIALSA